MNSIMIILFGCIIIQEIQIIILQRKVNSIEEMFTDILVNKIQEIFVRAKIDDENDEEDTGA